MSTIATAKLKTKTSLIKGETLADADEFSGAMDIAPTSSDPIVSEPPKGGKRRALLGVLALLLIIGGAIGITMWLHSQNFESTDDATVEARVIPISPQIAARVKAVHISDNQFVHQGDVLVELDPTDFSVALDQAKASESAANGRLTQARFPG